MNKLIVVGLVGVVGLGVVYTVVYSQQETEMVKEQMMDEKISTGENEAGSSQIVEKAANDEGLTVQDSTTEAMDKDEKKMMEGKTEAMMKKDEMSMMDKDMEKDGMMMKGSYEVYAPEKLARAETGAVVLFFHASWCPSCRGLNSDIEANMSVIPDGVSILKVDYDKEAELKKKYGVTYQHTLVQVDKDGNLLKKWSGGPTLSNLVSEIQ